MLEKIAAQNDNCLVSDHYEARLLPLMHNFIDALAGNTHQIADLPLREMNLNQRPAIHLSHFGRSQQSYRPRNGANLSGPFGRMA